MVLINYPKDYILQDWGLTYDELEPYFYTFEQTAGISGDNKNPLKGKDPIPNPPNEKNPYFEKVRNGNTKLGYSPLMMPSANLSEAIQNPDGQRSMPVNIVGFCERFGCEYGAKVSPEITVVPTARKTGKFDVRFNANVVEVIKSGNKVTGVRYVDTFRVKNIFSLLKWSYYQVMS